MMEAVGLRAVRATLPQTICSGSISDHYRHIVQESDAAEANGAEEYGVTLDGR